MREVVREREYDQGGVAAEREIERVREDADPSRPRRQPNDWVYEAAGIILLLVASGAGLWALSVRAARHMPPEYFAAIVGLLTTGLWVLQTDLDAPFVWLVRKFFLSLFTVGCTAGLIAVGLWFPEGWGWLLTAVCGVFLVGLLRQYRGG